MHILSAVAQTIPIQVPAPEESGTDGLLIFVRVLMILLALLLLGLLLLQVRGTNLNLLGSADSSFRARRGIERWLFRSTIIVGVLFVLVAIINIRF